MHTGINYNAFPRLYSFLDYYINSIVYLSQYMFYQCKYLINK